MIDVAGRYVLGVPGGSLDSGGTWAATNADTRAKAADFERATAKILNAFASVQGATVLHDLRMPSQNSTANIDHAVVTGSKVFLIDTKWWKPGFYWTMGKTSRIGLHKAPHLDKQTIAMGRTQVGGLLLNAGIHASVQGMVVVWPSSSRKATRTWALDVPGAGTIPAGALERWAKATMKPRRAADADIVSALADLLISKPRPTGYIAAGVPD